MSARQKTVNVQAAARKRWGDRSAVGTAVNLSVARIDDALRVVNDLIQRGEM